MGAIYRSSPTAAQLASQVASKWPTTTLLRPPTVVAVASGATSMIAPYTFHVAPPTPDGTPHLQSKPITFETVAAKPKVEPVVKPDALNAAEVLLVAVLVIVIGVRVYVSVIDAAGNVLARAG